MGVLIAGGCGFEAASNPDAAPLPDAPADAAGTMACPWPHTPSDFDPCSGVPSGMLPELDLQLDGTYLVDTDDGTLTAPGMIDIPVPTTVVGDVRVMWVRRFRLGFGSTLRAVGDPPLVLVSYSEVLVDGTIDVGSHVLGSDKVGAGSDPLVCGAGVATGGTTCTHGGSGGGGGGFGGAGAAGGPGGFGRDCSAGATSGIAGGAGGVATSDANLRGGCDGGDGADGNNPAAGTAGDGGGAIHVIARDALVVRATGKILAGGGGGIGANGGRSGGGGGGSGGLIVLAGTTIRVDAGGVLAANGGGGGGGVNGGAAGNGDDGAAGAQAASG
ncbi:MAG: hypothetical protein H6Q90_6949, partial [Deltaproteobacteria bacterium]|nr:hypothetical protein [Deltaproteobacteria bacterium]